MQNLDITFSVPVKQAVVSKKRDLSLCSVIGISEMGHKELVLSLMYGHIEDQTLEPVPKYSLWPLPKSTHIHSSNFVGPSHLRAIYSQSSPQSSAPGHMHASA